MRGVGLSPRYPLSPPLRSRLSKTLEANPGGFLGRPHIMGLGSPENGRHDGRAHVQDVFPTGYDGQQPHPVSRNVVADSCDPVRGSDDRGLEFAGATAVGDLPRTVMMP
jgi:hypothetical protein